MGKNWWESKTVWFNVLALVLAIVAAVAKHFGYDEFVPGEDMQEIILLAVAVVNLILRYTSKQTINSLFTGKAR